MSEADAEKEIKVYDDVPRTALAVRGKEEARTALARLRGDQVPNECLFSCIMCGWKGTIRFDDDEIAAMDGDVESYGGPCSGFAKDDKGQTIYEKDAQGEFVVDAQGQKTPVPCGQMTLLPTARMGQGDFTPGEQVAKRQKMRELREQAEVNAEVFVEKAAATIGAFMAPMASSTTAPEAPVAEAPPATAETTKSEG
jgi:hypothetical protein